MREAIIGHWLANPMSSEAICGNESTLFAGSPLLMNACSALWLTPSRTRTKCTRGGCRPDAKACANAAAAASKSAWLTFDVSVAFELGQTTPLHAQNTQNMPLRHEGAAVLLASRPHQSAHIAECCVESDQHDAFAFIVQRVSFCCILF